MKKVKVQLVVNVNVPSKMTVAAASSYVSLLRKWIKEAVPFGSGISIAVSKPKAVRARR